MSMLSQAFYVIIDRGISAPGHVRELVYLLNIIDKRFILKLMSIVKLTGAKVYNTEIVIHTGTCAYDVSLAREFQKHLSKGASKHGMQKLVCITKH